MLSISKRFEAYATGTYQQLLGRGLRAQLDVRSEKVGYKIREAQAQEIPYMLVVGAKELESKTVRVRHRSGDDLGAMPVAAFLDLVEKESEHGLAAD